MNNKIKPTDSFTGKTKPDNEYSSISSYLLQENSYYLLLEDGGKIIINLGGKEKPTSVFTNKTI